MVAVVPPPLISLSNSLSPCVFCFSFYSTLLLFCTSISLNLHMRIDSPPIRVTIFLFVPYCSSFYVLFSLFTTNNELVEPLTSLLLLPPLRYLGVPMSITFLDPCFVRIFVFCYVLFVICDNDLSNFLFFFSVAYRTHKMVSNFPVVVYCQYRIVWRTFLGMFFLLLL